MRASVIMIAAVAALVVGVSTSTTSAQASGINYPVNWSTTAAVASGAIYDVRPPGANNWFCRPDAAHPNPVILVHGVLANQNIAWQALSPTLANNGYCVFTLSYGQTWYSGNLGGVADISASAYELNSFVNKVRMWTGANKVDLVGHSEGGNLARLYMKTYGPAKVGKNVGIAAVNGPPSFSGLITVADNIPGATDVIDYLCPACDTLLDPSYFTALDTPAATFGGVEYTNIASTHDEAVTPYELAFLPSAANVHNLTIQTLCPNDPVGHLGITYDRTAVQLTLNALDPAHPQPVPCTTGFPL